MAKVVPVVGSEDKGNVLLAPISNSISGRQLLRRQHLTASMRNNVSDILQNFVLA